MTDRNRKLLINTALMLHKEKLEKKLKKEKEKFDKLCEIKLPARQGIRGGMNTKITSRIEISSNTMKTLKEQIKVLDEEIKKNKELKKASAEVKKAMEEIVGGKDD